MTDIRTFMVVPPFLRAASQRRALATSGPSAHLVVGFPQPHWGSAEPDRRLRPDVAKSPSPQTASYKADDQPAGRKRRETEMRKALEIGGFVAAAVLIVFGVAAIVMGVNGRSTVQDSLKAEQIVGSADMTPALIKKEATDAGLSVSSLDIPTVAVAGKSIDTGGEARAFAQYLRIHALESSGGLVYAQMGRFVAANGAPEGTSDEALAAKGADGQPVANAARNTWVTATALSTALNTSYMADQLALFGIVVGIALLLSGIGFGVLAVGGTLRNPDPALKIFSTKSTQTAGATPVPT